MFILGKNINNFKNFDFYQALGKLQKVRHLIYFRKSIDSYLSVTLIEIEGTFVNFLQTILRSIELY